MLTKDDDFFPFLKSYAVLKMQFQKKNRLRLTN